MPTQMSERSVARTAALTSLVAKIRLAPRCSAMISPMSFSMIGVRPALMRSTFDCCGSTPTTSWPSFARHPAETAPT